MEIQVTCYPIDPVNIEELLDLQGDLKDLTQENYLKLRDSIVKFGFSFPVFVWIDAEGHKWTIDSHQRQRVLKKMRNEEGYTIPLLPAYATVATDKAQAKEKLLLLNSRYGTMTQEGFDAFVADIPMEDIADLLTIPEIMIEGQDDSEPVEDEVPEVSNEPAVSQLGQVYQLGRHRLMCGDATKIEDVEKLMNGQKADMVFTDPPYNIDYQDVQHSHEKIQNDKMTNEQFIQFLKDTFALFNSPRGYICCNWKCYPQFYQAMEESGLMPKSCIVWDKKHGTQNLDKYFKQHEFVIYYGEFGGERTLRGDVWEIAREVREDHPTAKPVELCAKAIQDSTGSEGSVLDVFGGSGSTLIACEQTNRTCYMMELDPRYCDVIRKRYAKFVSPDTWEQDWQTLTPSI